MIIVFPVYAVVLSDGTFLGAWSDVYEAKHVMLRWSAEFNHDTRKIEVVEAEVAYVNKHTEGEAEATERAREA